MLGYLVGFIVGLWLLSAALMIWRHAVLIGLDDWKCNVVEIGAAILFGPYAPMILVFKETRSKGGYSG